ncbi:MAG: methionyl-tRNA synthetase [Parcubacteria group bacterium Gr01-1014_33]|nr:MAG: methionyl-tRNA synthetase [Parcubacteria group bacterium Gr01-1014_33]
METISFEQFKKLDLRVGKIVSAERMEGSEKLLKLEVDIGAEKRQIIAGIGTRYEPKNLAGKEIVVVVNLELRRLMGLESQGMLLAADADGPVILCPEKDVPPGSVIK